VGAATAFSPHAPACERWYWSAEPPFALSPLPASTGAFRAQFDNPEEIALVRESITLFERFAEVAGLPGYDLDLRQQGYLWLAISPEGIARQQTPRSPPARVGGLPTWSGWTAMPPGLAFHTCLRR
jgi:hypothetical protein